MEIRHLVFQIMTLLTTLTACLLKQSELRDSVTNENLEKKNLHGKYKTKEFPYNFFSCS